MASLRLMTATLLIITISSSCSQHVEGRHKKRQVTSQGLVIDSPQDRQPEETLLQAQALTQDQAHKQAQARSAPLASVQAQAKFFQDFFSVQLSPYKIEFGHVCEDPHTWEQRYERKDFKNHRDMGKVRWGDKHGGYGEHYWDYNHAGHGGDSHDEPSDNVHEYEEYDNDSNRNKRHSKHHDAPSTLRKDKYKNKKYEEELKHHDSAPIVIQDTTNDESNNDYDEELKDHDNAAPTMKKEIQKNYNKEVRNSHQDAPYSYKNDPGTRKEPKEQKQHQELYLDESTGHIVDKLTGQTYMLQPV